MIRRRLAQTAFGLHTFANLVSRTGLTRKPSTRVFHSQDLDDMQNSISGISNDLLLVMLAHGQREMDERKAAEARHMEKVQLDGGLDG